MELLIFILVAYGMSNILVWGSIFATPRTILHELAATPGIHQPVCKFFSELIACMMCTSTWVGFFLSIFFYSPAQELMNFTPYWSWFFDGCLASGAVWAVNALVEHWEHR
jgi:hypothetical protein